MSRLPPPIAYAPFVIPYPGTPGTPFFDGQNITDFLDRYNQLCSDYHLSESEKIYRLPWYCELFMGKYIKILIKGADWASVRSILRREYKNNDLDQLKNSRGFLEALKKKSRSEDDDLLHYCQFFASISRDLVLRKRLDLYTQCQWFLQGLPERVVMEIFYRYDIDLEDDDDLDFEDLLEKALVLVKRKKFLADFIRDEETDLANKYTEPQKAPTPTTYVPDIVESVPYMPQGLNPTTRLRVIQDDIPTARIRTTQVRKTEITKPIPDNTDCILSPGSTEDVLEGLSALFPDCEPLDEMVQVHVSSVGIVKHFEHHGVGESDTCGPDTKNHRQNISARLKLVFISGPGIRKKILKKETVQKFEAEAMKKAGMGIAEEMFVGLDGFVGGRPMQRARKCDDHG